MAEYSGSALYLEWIYSGGTVNLTADSRTFSSSVTIELYDSTAGSDAYKTFVTGMRDSVISTTLVTQSDGTVLLDALFAGTSGTVRVSPEGTASGKRRELYPAISQGVVRDEPYNNVVTYQISWQGNGAPTLTGAW